MALDLTDAGLLAESAADRAAFASLRLRAVAHLQTCAHSGDAGATNLYPETLQSGAAMSSLLALNAAAMATTGSTDYPDDPLCQGEWVEGWVRAAAVTPALLAALRARNLTYAVTRYPACCGFDPLREGTTLASWTPPERAARVRGTLHHALGPRFPRTAGQQAWASEMRARPDVRAFKQEVCALYDTLGRDFEALVKSAEATTLHERALAMDALIERSSGMTQWFGWSPNGTGSLCSDYCCLARDAVARGALVGLLVANDWAPTVRHALVPLLAQLLTSDFE
jgi:hypothetical protein